MRWTLLPGLLLALGCAACASAPPHANDELRQQVWDTERAFAATMSRRDYDAFRGFLSAEAVFFGSKGPLRGSEAVAAAWKKLYEQPDAPFSWEPAEVVVLDSGTLALSTGPVRDAKGKLIGTFSSIWRREAAGTWRIVFDKGCEACDCAKRLE